MKHKDTLENSEGSNPTGGGGSRVEETEEGAKLLWVCLVPF